ncbi:helix-hairpin-helix domain-containing protein [Dorea sp.]
MRRKKRQNKITEKRKIQKEICRIPLLFLVLLSVMCTADLTGCRAGNPQGQTELVPLDESDTDSDKPGTDIDSEQKDQQTDREKLQICYVHICGAVKQPGVYELTADSRLFEAIQMAGGLTEEAADQVLNQAELIEDGSRIYVPTKEEVKAGMDIGDTLTQNEDNAEKAGSTSDGKVDINTAEKNELMTLPGIGEAKADAIVRYREEHGTFQKIEDLMEVEGIKEGVFQKVKDQIKV